MTRVSRAWGNDCDYAPILLRIQPGLTGWWQVMGRHETTFEQRLRMDEYTISNWSLWMDFYILMKTVWVVLGGKGGVDENQFFMPQYRLW